MRAFGRNDVALLGALTVALFIMLSRPLSSLIEYARDVEQSTGLQLLPGLIILVTVFLFQQLRKRQEIQADAALAASAAKTATDRAVEMERLVTFGQALAHSLDEDAIRDVVVAHVPLLLPGRGAWVTIAEPADPETGDGIVRRTLTVVGDSSVESRERAARRVLGEVAMTLASPEDDICFPMIMFDLDGFKPINDTLGHLAGDAVLTAVGIRMRAVLRGSDLKCRYGGEEFLILLPDTPLIGAQRVAESLRRDLEMHPVKWAHGEIPISASFGVATSLPGEIDALGLVARADVAMYTARQSGRNCVRATEFPDALSVEQSAAAV
jgi:diguanylate cyclase (GGDEF)-like protein